MDSDENGKTKKKTKKRLSRITATIKKDKISGTQVE